MKQALRISPVIVAACVVLAMLVPQFSQRAAAQSPGLYVNAVDLDIVPAQRDNYLAAIKENSLAAIQEPGCRQFDILVLADDPNHLFLFEVYDDEAAFKAHRASDHFKKYASVTASMVAKRVTRTMGVIGTNSKPH